MDPVLTLDFLVLLVSVVPLYHMVSLNPVVPSDRIMPLATLVPFGPVALLHLSHGDSGDSSGSCSSIGSNIFNGSHGSIEPSDSIGLSDLALNPTVFR